MKSKFIFFAACVAYIGALFVPAIVIQANTELNSVIGENWYGYDLLVGGWFGILVGQFAWYANILLVVGFIKIYIGNYISGMKWFVSAFLLGLQTLAFDSYPRGEGPFYDVVDHFGSGFYFWELSFLLFFIYAWVRLGDKKYAK